MPPTGSTISLALVGDYTPPAGDSVGLAIAPPCHVAPPGNAVRLALIGEYAPPPGDQVGLFLVCDGQTPVPPPAPGYVWDGLSVGLRLRWDQGSQHRVSIAAPWQQAETHGAEARFGWTWGAERDHHASIAWQTAESRQRTVRIDLSTSTDPLAVADSLSWGSTVPHDAHATVKWDFGTSLQLDARLPYRNPPKKDAARRMSWDGSLPLSRALMAPFNDAAPHDKNARAPWGWATPLRNSYGELTPQPVPRPPAVPCYVPALGDRVRLALSRPVDPPSGDQVGLRVTCTQRYFSIYRRYIMQHAVSVVRLPDLLPLSVLGFDISIDRDSWAWTLSLTLADRASYHAIMPDGSGPKSVQINASGHVWTFVIDKAREGRRMPQSTFTASGRSLTAQLAEPYAIARPYINPSPTTAAQAAARELEFTGFGLDWQCDDWSIPAGAWHYDRETPMSAIARIARACGGIVQSHPSDPTVIVKPAYPAAPWNFASETPSVIIDGQSVYEMGRDWVPGPGYLGVYVSGEAHGVLVNVVRAGSAGSPYAEMVVDPLVTATEPARGIALRVIADSDNQTIEPIQLPLAPDPAPPGVIHPGELVQIEDPVHGIYKALCASTSINCSLSSEGAVSLTQTINVARHFPEDLS